jgi:hypothetical protein
MCSVGGWECIADGRLDSRFYFAERERMGYEIVRQRHMNRQTFNFATKMKAPNSRKNASLYTIQDHPNHPQGHKRHHLHPIFIFRPSAKVVVEGGIS